MTLRAIVCGAAAGNDPIVQPPDAIQDRSSGHILTADVCKYSELNFFELMFVEAKSSNFSLKCPTDVLVIQAAGER